VAAAGAVAAGIYGLYAGIGQETARSKAEGKDFSPARALTAAALEINPLVKSASRAVKLSRVAAQVAGATGLEYAHSKDNIAAGTAGLVTAVLGPVMYWGMRQPTKGSATTVAEALAPESANLNAKAWAQVDAESIPAWVRNREHMLPLPKHIEDSLPAAPRLDADKTELVPVGSARPSLPPEVPTKILDRNDEILNRYLTPTVVAEYKGMPDAFLQQSQTQIRAPKFKYDQHYNQAGRKAGIRKQLIPDDFTQLGRARGDTKVGGTPARSGTLIDSPIPEDISQVRFREAPETPEQAAARFAQLHADMPKHYFQQVAKPGEMQFDSFPIRHKPEAYTESELGKVVPREFVEFVVNADNLKGGPPAARAAAYGKFKDYWFKLSDDRRTDLWISWRLSKAMVKEAGEYLATRPLGQRDLEDIGKFRRWTAPAVYVSRKIDSVLESDVEGDLVKVLRAKDQYTVLAAGYFKALADLERRAHKLGKVEVQLGDSKVPLSQALFHAVEDETDELKAIVDRQAPGLVDDLRKLTRGLLQELEAQGLKPGNLGKGYMPQLAKQGAEGAVAVEDLLRRLGPLQDWYGKLEIPEVKQLTEYAARVYGHEPSPGELASLPKAIMQRFKQTQGVSPGAVLTRKGELPEFIQETDAFRLLERYIHGNLKAVVLESPLKRLQANQAALEAAGLSDSAQWLSSLVDRASGIPGGAVKQWTGMAETWRKSGLELLKANPDSKLGAALERLPETLGRLNALVYPARMISPRAWFRNSVQSYSTTAPELGGAWGYKLVGQGYLDAFKRHGFNVEDMKQYLQTVNQLGDISSERGVRREAMGKLGQAADLLNEKGMLPFTLTDLANRSVSMHIGARWAQALREGHPAAIKALDKASAGLKAQVRAHDLADPDLEHVLGSYLITKTQFRYGPEAQSELVRLLGPAFGQFTMWPQMVFWDLVERGQARDVAGLANRFLPLAGLLGVGHLIKESKSSTLEYFLGNPEDLSPIPGVLGTGVLLGEGPAVKAALKAPGALGQLFREEKPGRAAGKLGRDMARGLLTDWVPPVSAVVNEIDRWDAATKRAKGQRDPTSKSREFVNKYLGGD
jgi:hypothetical protein